MTGGGAPLLPLVAMPAPAYYRRRYQAMKLAIRIALTLCMTGLATFDASAKCGPTTLAAAWETAEIVFRGTVVAVDSIRARRSKRSVILPAARFRVEETLKVFFSFLFAKR